MGISLLVALVLATYVAFAPVAATQPTGWLSYVLQDPQAVVQFRVFGAYGAPGFIGTGTAVPTLANSGQGPVNGEQFLVRDNAAANEPVLVKWSGPSAGWQASVVSTLATNAVDVANSVWFGTGQIIFEGATVNAFETIITVADTLTGDVTATIPIDNAQWGGTGTFMFSTLATNAPEAANSIWGASNALVFEGLTQNGFELSLAPADVGQDLAYTMPDIGAATGAMMFSTLATNNVDIANSVWFTANTLNFGGATGGDGFELQITPEDHATADRVVAINDYDANSALVHSLLATNAPDANNAIWFGTNQIIFEGATGGNAVEFMLQPQDPTADLLINLVDHNYGQAAYNGTELDYVVPMTPVIHAASGYFSIPPLFTHTEDVVMDSTTGANSLYVFRMYLPYQLTISDASVLLVDGGALAAADIVGVAIYEDADAGVQITTGTGDGTAAGLETVALTDVTLYPGFYRFAVCSSDAVNLHLAGTLFDDEHIDIVSGVAGDIAFGVGGNACVAGVPPATTGAIATDDEAIPFIYFH